MKHLLMIAGLMALASGCTSSHAAPKADEAARAAAQEPASGQAYPGCDLATQRDLDAPTGGTITDPRQAHIAKRAEILQADISTARTARRLPQDKADRLWKKIAAITQEMDGYVKQQGFLSAAERASYDRELDAVAMQLCG